MKRVLVIDDDARVRETVKKVLGVAGYEVVEACEGKAGLEEFKSNGADLVITDIIMPGMEGYETIRALRTHSPDLKILAMSGGGRLGPQSYLSIAKKIGAIHTLTKPFGSSELRDAVRAVLGE